MSATAPTIPASGGSPVGAERQRSSRRCTAWRAARRDGSRRGDLASAARRVLRPALSGEIGARRHSSGNAHRWSRLPGSSCCGAAGVVEIGEVGGQGRVIELLAVEPGVELAEGAGVGAAGIGADRGVDQAARGRARPADRGVGRGDPGGLIIHDNGTYRPSIGRFIVRTPAGAGPTDRPSEHGLTSRSRA